METDGAFFNDQEQPLSLSENINYLPYNISNSFIVKNKNNFFEIKEENEKLKINPYSIAICESKLSIPNKIKI